MFIKENRCFFFLGGGGAKVESVKKKSATTSTAAHVCIVHRNANATKWQVTKKKGRTKHIGREGGVQFFHAQPQCQDHRPSHPYDAGTAHVGLSPTTQTTRAPSAERGDVFGDSHEGCLKAASCQEPLARRTSAPCAQFVAQGRQLRIKVAGDGSKHLTQRQKHAPSVVLFRASPPPCRKKLRKDNSGWCIYAHMYMHIMFDVPLITMATMMTSPAK